MAEDRSTTAAPVNFDALIKGSIGNVAQSEGTSINKDAMSGGSMSPVIKGEWTPNKNGVGQSN